MPAINQFDMTRERTSLTLTKGVGTLHVNSKTGQKVAKRQQKPINFD